jgi:tetratricopeptide (TPR) repeat protein
MATSAYRQSLGASQGATLNTLIASAQSFEKKEDWQQALSQYQKALQQDGTQVTAKLGKIRSEARYALEKRIQAILDNPIDLGKQRNKINALEVLTDARGIKKRGPKLSKQISHLESVLKAAEQVIKVELISDSMTLVSLIKQGSKRIELGRFEKKNLALKTGKYVLIGIRSGYQDVRVELELFGGQQQKVKTITVRCDNKVALNALRSAQQGKA